MTLREIFLVIAVAAAGITAMRLGGVFADCFFLFAAVATLAMGISCFTDSEARRAFAIGWTLCVAVYAGAVVTDRYERRPEPPYLPRQLPTSKLLTRIYLRATATPTTVKRDVRVRNASPEILARIFGRPNPFTFMITGHTLFALLFGYAGGKYGEFVYKRRFQD